MLEAHGTGFLERKLLNFNRQQAKKKHTHKNIPAKSEADGREKNEIKQSKPNIN